MRTVRLVVVLVLVALCGALAMQMVLPSVAHAATSYTWTGQGLDGKWANAANWSPNGIPGTGDDVSIGPNPANNVTMPGSTTVHSLSLSGNGAGLTGGSLTITGTFTWAGSGEISTAIDIPSGATANIINVSGDGKRFDTTLSVEGTASLSGSGLVLSGGGAVITNTGTFTLNPGASINAGSCCVSPAQFINKGSVVVPASSAGTQSATIDAVSFIDSSTVSIGSNSILDLQYAPSTFAAGVSFTGGGTLLLDNNINVQLSGTVNLGNGTTFQVGSSGGSYAVLTGTGTLTGTGSAFSWVDGTLNGNFTVASSVTTTISGTDAKQLATSGGNTTSTLTLAGPTTLSGTSTLSFSGGGANLINTNTFTADPGSTITAGSCCVSPAQFVNQGSFVVPSSSSGTQSVIVNALNFNDSGTVSIGSNSILDLRYGPSTFAAGVTFNGSGTLLMDNSAGVQLSGTVNLGNGTTFQVGSPGGSYANLTGTGTLTGTGSTFSWVDGTLNGNFTVASSVHTTISGADAKLLATSGGNTTSTLTLAGTTTLSGTSLILSGGGAILNNTGTFTPQAGSTITAQSCCVNPAQFNNKGKLVVNIGTGNTFSLSSVAFNNSGTVTLSSGTMQFGDPGYTQTGGSTALKGGALTSTTSAILNLKGGKLTGKGTITASVQNAALIDPGKKTPGEGLLQIAGNYTQTSAGTLRADIAGTTPGGTYDQLSVSGTASLNGTLDIMTASGYTPTTSDQFIVVNAQTVTGTFATLLNSQITPHLQYYAQYTTTTASLNVKQV